MSKKLTIIASILLIVGVSTLGWTLAENKKVQGEAARYKLKYSARTDEYLEQYRSNLACDGVIWEFGYVNEQDIPIVTLGMTSRT